MSDLSLAPVSSAATPGPAPSLAASRPVPAPVEVETTGDTAAFGPTQALPKSSSARAAATSEPPGPGLIPPVLVPDDDTKLESTEPSSDRTLQPLPTVTKTGAVPTGSETTLRDQFSDAALSWEQKVGISAASTLSMSSTYHLNLF